MSLIHNVVGNPDAERVLLLIHGYGADERDLGGLLPYLDPEGHFLTVLPRGPGRRRRPGSPGTTSGRCRRRARRFRRHLRRVPRELDDLLDARVRRARQAPRRGHRRRVLAGRRRSRWRSVCSAPTGARPGGVLAMSPYLPDVEGVEYDWARREVPPVLVQHGTDDPLIPVERGRDLARTLEAHGVPVVYREYPMEHQVALESRAAGATRWLDAGASPASCPTSRCPRIRSSSCRRSRPRRSSRGAAQRDAGDRRLLGAVVRAVPPGVADRRADRGDAPGLVQGREGQHRRRADARAEVRACRASR